MRTLWAMATPHLCSWNSLDTSEPKSPDAASSSNLSFPDESVVLNPVGQNGDSSITRLKFDSFERKVHSPPEVNNPYQSNIISSDTKHFQAEIQNSNGLTKADSVLVPSSPSPADHTGSYKWLVLACCYITVMLSIGPGFTLGVYYNVLVKDFNASNTQVAFITGMHPGLLLIAGAAASLLTASYGFRRVILAGGLMSSIGFALPFYCTEIWQVQLGVGILAAVGAGIAHVAAFGLIGFYFAADEHKRHLASLILVMAPETGNLIFAQLHRVLMFYFTWRGALLMVAGIVLNIIPCALAIRDPDSLREPKSSKNDTNRDSLLHDASRGQSMPSESSHDHRNLCRRLVHNSLFWLIMIHAFFMGCYSTVITVFPRFATLERNFGMESATAVLSLGSLATITARFILALTVLSPKVHSRIKFFGIFHVAKFIGGLAMVLLPVWHDKAAIVIDFVLITLGWGVKFGAYPIIIMKVLGPESLGFVWGFSTFVDGISCLGAPLLAGLLADQTGSFAFSYYLCGGCMLISGIPMVAVNILHAKRTNQSRMRRQRENATVTAPNNTNGAQQLAKALSNSPNNKLDIIMFDSGCEDNDSAAVVPECATAVEFCCHRAKLSINCSCSPQTARSQLPT